MSNLSPVSGGTGAALGSDDWECVRRAVNSNKSPLMLTIDGAVSVSQTLFLQKQYRPHFELALQYSLFYDACGTNSRVNSNNIKEACEGIRCHSTVKLEGVRVRCMLELFSIIWRYWFVISIFLSIVIVFFQRNQPESVWAWLLVLYFIPGVGFILYLVLHQDYNKKHMFRIKEVEDTFNAAHFSAAGKLGDLAGEIKENKLQHYNKLVRYNHESGGAVYTDDNYVEIVTDGKEKFRRLIEEIDRAEYYIHLQYYIIQDDELFEEIKEHLYKKVREGVVVRLLYDPLGCRRTKNKLWDELKANGVRVGNFFPAVLGILHVRMNYRNHRKIVVIDGRVAFVGGYNIGREYISMDKNIGYWRDTHLILTGSSVIALEVRFALDWNYAAKENLFLKPHMFSYLKRKSDAAADVGTTGNVGMQIISSGPDSAETQIRNTYVSIINEAKRQISIQTPYFIPDQTLMSALHIAIKSGVEVRLMIPCKPDHPFVYWATYSYMGDLLKAGARCYVYENGFLHAKGLTADGEVACYGTANMDIRSFSLNFEVNAVIYDTDVARELEDIFDNDTINCREVSLAEYRNRSLTTRMKEQISRLLSPVL